MRQCAGSVKIAVRSYMRCLSRLTRAARCAARCEARRKTTGGVAPRYARRAALRTRAARSAQALCTDTSGAARRYRFDTARHAPGESARRRYAGVAPRDARYARMPARKDMRRCAAQHAMVFMRAVQRECARVAHRCREDMRLQRYSQKTASAKPALLMTKLRLPLLMTMMIQQTHTVIVSRHYAISSCRAASSRSAQHARYYCEAEDRRLVSRAAP